MMGSYMGSGVSQVINYTPPQVNNFYNQGSNYGQGQPQAPQNYGQPQPQAPQGYGQGQSYSVPQPAPSYPPVPQQNYGYNAPSVNNYYNQGGNYAAPQQPQSSSYPPPPQQDYSYPSPTAQGQGYNYNANVPIVNVYNQVQGPRYNNNPRQKFQEPYAPKPSGNHKPYGQGMQMSPDFVKGFMMASMGMGMLAGQIHGQFGAGKAYGMGDDDCPPSMKKKPSYDVQKPYNPPAKPYDDATTLPVFPYGRGGGVLMNEPSFEADTSRFWGDIQNPATNLTTTVDAPANQQAVEEMSQMFFFFLAAASQSQSVGTPQLQQPQAPQQEQAQGFPFPPGLLELIQGYMN